jgi:hypothetical protein
MAEARAEEIYTRYVSGLPFAEQLWLLALIARGLSVRAADVAEPPSHDIRELHGLGKEIWEGIDAQEYVNALREGRPLPGERPLPPP